MDKMCLTVHGSFGGSCVINEEVVYNGCVIVDMDKTIKGIEKIKRVEGLTNIIIWTLTSNSMLGAK